MNLRTTFDRIMSYEPFERLPVWYFGTWSATLERWKTEGLSSEDAIPQETGMDPDWEKGKRNAHGLMNFRPITGMETTTIKEDEHQITARTYLGDIIRWNKGEESMPETVQYALKPTRQSWDSFKKYLDPTYALRYKPGWEKQAEAFEGRTHATCFVAGSLYGWPRDWMGVEEWSVLFYDNPALAEEIIDTLTNYFIEIYRPLLKKTRFEFGYFNEDCCFNTGPLLPPNIYRDMFDTYYRRLVSFYKDNGVKCLLVDSDGKLDDLIPCWLDSGIDAVFPVEVGTWKAHAPALRKHFGKSLRMIGGVDKHVIPKGEGAIRKELEPLVSLAEEGGYIPLPDHRIPPDCSLEQFRTYVRVFKSVFKNTGYENDRNFKMELTY